MKWFDIRTRVLLAALLPVLMVGVGLSVAFLLGRSSDLNASYQQRARSLARQLASASEYGIFSSNAVQLYAICMGAAKDPDVRSVDVFDSHGNRITRVGAALTLSPTLGDQESRVEDAERNLDMLVQPVYGSQIGLDDVFEPDARALPKTNQLLGHVVLVMSRQSLVALERNMLMLGIMVTLGGLLLGALVALLIARGVIKPIQRVMRQVARLEGGELGYRAPVHPDDPFAALQRGLNSMAQHLQDSQQLLEFRVETATQELRAQKESAEEATQSKSRFLAAASHDLRQPSHAMGMILSRLLQFPHGEEETEVLAQLSASVRAQQDLLDSLLDMAQLDAQAIKTSIQALSITELFAPLAHGLQAQAQAKHLRLRIRKSPLWVLSDPVLLTRIVMNLVHNALRYTDHGGILIACRPVRGQRSARIEVWDTGVGIEPAYQKEIFKEFFQVGNSERDRNKGLGLGLGIVERTARLLGHTVAVKSVPGRGSCFSILLPLASSPDPVAPPDSRPATTLEEPEGVRLLVIEDDVLVSQAMVMMLTSWGCEVAHATGIQEALVQLGSGPDPQLVVSDYRLRGGENGLEALRVIRERTRPDLPACLISGDVASNLANVCREAGIQFLQKPVRAEALRRVILEAVR